MNLIRVLFFLIFSLAFAKTPIAAQSTLLPSIEPGVSLDLAEHRKLTLSDINYQLEFTLPADHRDPCKRSCYFYLVGCKSASGIRFS